MKKRKRKKLYSTCVFFALHLQTKVQCTEKNLIHIFNSRNPFRPILALFSPYPRHILASLQKQSSKSRKNFRQLFFTLECFLHFQQGLETTTFWHAASNKLFFFFVTMFQAVQKKKENKKIINQKSKRKTIIRKQKKLRTVCYRYDILKCYKKKRNSKALYIIY